VKTWVPELKNVSERDVHSPWVVGRVKGYPAPIVKPEMWRRHEGRKNDEKKENFSENVEPRGKYWR